MPGFEIIKLPTLKETFLVVGGCSAYLLVTHFCIGLRIEHVVLLSVFCLLFFPSIPLRKLAVALLPFAVFGASYDYMRIYPNYEVNPIDIEGLYRLEQTLFGITTGDGTVIPSEYFTVHNCAFADFLAGLFYLCWVPVPMAFGIYLYIRKERELYLKLALVFLFINFLGFAGYYIHPAAPPWYVMEYGFKPLLDIPGEVAGLGRFDNLIGMDVFKSIYGRNSNVFAAVPSLHSAYMVAPFYYACVRKSSKWLILLFGVILAGIWWTAVYTAHHYIIDVILGIGCAVLGIVLFECVLMRWSVFSRFYKRYLEYIR